MAKQEQAVAYLFNEKTRYQVPLYQRRYVWDEPNWEALWQDIIDLQDNRNHFTGTIITKSVNSGEGDSYIIVDGQQRLTTFQIIFCVIRDLWQSGICTRDISSTARLYREIDHKLFTLTELGSLGTTSSSSKVNSSTDENGANNNGDDEEYQYRIYIKKEREKTAFESVVSKELWNKEIECKLPKDEVERNLPSLQRAFNSLFEKGSDNQQNQSQQHRIITAYGYFGKKITDYLVNNTAQHEDLMTLLGTLLYDFYAVSANLETEDRPQQAYRSINDTGVVLDEFDLLRNDLFLRAGNHNKEEEYYNKFWVVFGEDGVENHFWEKPGRTDQFLNDFLKAKLGPKRDFGRRIFHHDYKGTYTDLLEEKLKGDQNDKEFIEKEFHELSKYAKTYEDMEKENPTTDIGRRRQFYKDLNSIFENLDLTSIPPFMLYIENELELDDNERDRVYQVLESFVLRRQLSQGVNVYDITEDIKYLFRLIFEGGINIRKHKAAETVAQCLASMGKGKSWLNNERILNGLNRVGSQIDNSPKLSTARVWNMLKYIFYRIECRMDGSDKSYKSFSEQLKEMFGDTKLKHIRPPSRGEPYRVSYSIGNLTFCNRSLTARLLFSQRKAILLSKPNSNLGLNQTMEKYKEHKWWDEWAIKDREKRLLTHFHEIWPSPEAFTNTSTDSASDSESGPGWISTLEAPIILQSYEEEPQESTEIPTTFGTDILFVCSSESWQELYAYVKSINNVRIKQLSPIQSQSKQLNIDDNFLKFAREEQATAYLTTRYGHLLEGTIEEFSKDVIHLQVREESVIVFRNGLLEFTTDISYEGIVKNWRPDDLFGSIECETTLPKGLQEIEVKSEFLDQYILSRKLLSHIKVNFNLKIIRKNGLLHYEAHNVKPITTGRLHRGKIKSFRPEKGSGFLELDDYKEAIYINKSQVLPEDRNLLKEGQQVEFNIAETIEGQSSVAINVKVVQ